MMKQKEPKLWLLRKEERLNLEKVAEMGNTRRLGASEEDGKRGAPLKTGHEDAQANIWHRIQRGYSEVLWWWSK